MSAAVKALDQNKENKPKSYREYWCMQFLKILSDLQLTMEKIDLTLRVLTTGGSKQFAVQVY